MPIPDSFPYFFERSVYARLLPDTSSMTEPYWICLYYKRFDATIHLTYKSLNQDKKKFRDLIEDSRKLKNKHQIKASSIREKIYRSHSGISVDFFELEGEVPSPYQFYTSDSISHFLRGALYFNIATKNDSLAPVIGFLKEDIEHLIETLRWRGEGRWK